MRPGRARDFTREPARGRVIHMAPLGIGLLGLGRHGLRYAGHLARGEIPGARLAAVWRRDRAAGEALAAELGATFEPRAEALAARSDVDAVIAAVPAALHRDLAEAVASAQKPLLLEKPLARTLEEGEAICRAFEAAGQVLMVAHTLRFDPLLPALGARMEALGPVTGFSFEQRLEPRGLPWEDDPAVAGGGVLLQTAIHTVDAVRVLLQPEALELLHASLGQVGYRRVEDVGLLHLAARGSPLAAGRDVLGDVRASKIGGSRHMRFAVFLERGGLEADFIDRALIETRGRERTVTPVPELPTLVAAVRAFVAAVRGGANPVPGRDALASLAVVRAAYAPG